MAEIIVGGEKEGDSSAAVPDNGGSPKNHGPSSRNERRKEAKKMKRKRLRKELAVKERKEEEARLNDPEEQARMKLKEREEAERAEKERRIFEERDAMWLEAAKKAKEEAERKLLEESHREPVSVKCENELNEDDSWEYIEEGPAEIIWQGNEIIVKKNKVRVPKRSIDQQMDDEIVSRPTSNPLPPQSAAFDDYRKTNATSTQTLFETVAQQTPNFGTEQDKAHCPFHFKTGACRFGPRCSRVHFYPDKSCTMLIKNMYNGPGLAWEQDEGLEITCEFVGVTRWRVAICGEYMKSRHKTCSRGSTCNFIHCFRNPGGDYEWADWDKLPPKYWVEKMVALFGPSAIDEDEEKGKCEELVTSRKTPRDSSHSHHSSRSKSRHRHNVNDDSDMEDLGESGRFHHRRCSRKTDYHRSRTSVYESHDDHRDDREQSHRYDWNDSSDGINSEEDGGFTDCKYSKRKAYDGHGQHSSRGVEAHHTDYEHTCDLGYLDSDTEKEYSDKCIRRSSTIVDHHHRRSGSTQRDESFHADDFDHSPKKGCRNSDKRRRYAEGDGHSIHIDHSSRERRHHHHVHGSSRRDETWSSDTEEHSERWSCSKASNTNNVTSNCGHHKNVDIGKSYPLPNSVHDGMVSVEENQSRDETHRERDHQKHLSSSRERKRKKTEGSWKRRNDDVDNSDDLKQERPSRRDKTVYDQETPYSVRNEQLLGKSSKSKHRRHSIDEESDHLKSSRKSQ